MNGAESLVRTLVAGGVDVCFTNPGTSEMHIVAALDQVPEMRCVLGLFEGVVTGAADGYARMASKPGCTLLHLGPGFANGMANLHNASRAHVPMINVIGEHATFHLRHDAPLTSDIQGIARPYSQWLRTSTSAREIGCDVIDAIVAARTPPGRISTLVVPADAAWSDGGAVAKLPALRRPPTPPQVAIDNVIAILRSGAPTAILLAGSALYGEGLSAAGQVAECAGAKLFSPYPFARMERGCGLPAVQRIQYVREQAVEQLASFAHVILAGATVPVTYFAAEGKPSEVIAPECKIHTLAQPGEDCVSALLAVAEGLPTHGKIHPREQMARPKIPTGQITLTGLAEAVGALLPENAIVVDESMTSGRSMLAATRAADRHDWLANTGGSIGIALPLAVGAAVACPRRRVLCLSADGSGMYTLQALWTMAREKLKITVVIFANRAYAVLKREFSNLGIGDPGPRTRALFDIGQPDLDWVSLAKGMGVPGIRATSLDTFTSVLSEGFTSNGPTVIEVVL